MRTAPPTWGEAFKTILSSAQALNPGGGRGEAKIPVLIRTFSAAGEKSCLFVLENTQRHVYFGGPSVTQTRLKEECSPAQGHTDGDDQKPVKRLWRLTEYRAVVPSFENSTAIV